jgi:hypothetical protein
MSGEGLTMLAHHVRLRIALVFISMVAAAGCAVGTAYVNAPSRLPPEILPELSRPIRFDVCVAPEPRQKWQHLDENRRALGDRVRIALRHAGVRADLTSDAGSPVDFTVSLHSDFGPDGSAVLSFLTLSVVPGYLVQRKTLNVDIAARDAAQGGEARHLQYQARTTLLIWLPLIVAPDVFMSLSGGWQTPKIDDGGFREMVARLGDDLRLRLGRFGADLPPPQPPGVKCDNSLDHAPSDPRHRPAVVAAGLR